MSSANRVDHPGPWNAPDGYSCAVSPTEPGDDGGYPDVAEARAIGPVVPQALVTHYAARYTRIYGRMGVAIDVAVARAEAATAILSDRGALIAWNRGWLQLAVTASRRGGWQAYFADDHTVSHLSRGDTAYAELGYGGSTATWWLFPDQAAPLEIWLFAYLDGRLVRFEPQSDHPQRVDSNGGLRCFVSVAPG